MEDREKTKVEGKHDKANLSIRLTVTFVFNKTIHFMKYLEQVQTLWSRAKGGTHDLATLATLLEDYKTLLGQVMTSDESYRAGLRRLQEELPDLQRLITRKHDAILKGRLQDAIVALKKKVEVVEAPIAEPDVPATATADESGNITEEKRPIRNMPTLGMD
jgi:hypothetical protein